MKKHKKKSIVVTVVFLAVVTVVALVCVRCSGNRQDDGQNEKGFGWGTGITENLPCFSENVDSFDQGEAYVAAYYSNVTSEQVSEYLAKLDEQCGIKFEGQQYPRSATLDDRVIAIHYNVTEMRFSVTVVAKDIGDDADIH